MSDQIRCTVISHTHWDREWYLGFEAFRMQLVDLMDRVLDLLDRDSTYVFHLDAQTVVLDDYLEIRTAEKERIRTHVASGRLLVGPWHVQNDFFLTSGEATIRNLRKGTTAARQYGKSMMIGYMPDQFGLPGQIPQILTLFGINTAVFGRGYTFWERTDEGLKHLSRPTELWWEGPDGTRILGLHLCNWYNNAQRFPQDLGKSLPLTLDIVDRLRSRSTTGDLLLMNGVDHLQAQEDLLPILERLQKLLPADLTIAQGDLETYAARMHSLLAQAADGTAVTPPVWKGELREGHDYELLSGTLSTRVYLKVLNAQAQNRLEKQVEPLASLLTAAGLGPRRPQDELAYAWSLLLTNHPHDSICGCSTDIVHASMENRYARLNLHTTTLIERYLAVLQRHILQEEGTYSVLVVNTLPFPRSGLVEAEVFLPDSLGADQIFELSDHVGSRVRYEILYTDRHALASLSPVNLPGILPSTRLRIRFMATAVPGTGWNVYTVRILKDPLAPQGASALSPEPTRHASSCTTSEPSGPLARFENDKLSVSILQDGTITLSDASSHQFSTASLVFEDGPELGDTYVHAGDPVQPARRGFSGPVTVRSGRPSRFQQSCTLTGSIETPNGQDGPGKVDITVELVLEHGSARLDANLTLCNTGSNHRLRLVLDTGRPYRKVAVSAPFEILERTRKPAGQATRSPDEPTSGLVSTGSWAVLAEGLYEFEPLAPAEGSLAFTLLRCCSRITIDGGTVDNAPGIWLAPEAQCHRTIQERFSIVSPACSVVGSPSGLMRLLDGRFNPLLSRFDSADPMEFTGGRPAVQDTRLQHVFQTPDPYASVTCRPLGGVFAVDDPQIAVTALFPVDQDLVEFHVCNLVSAPGECLVQVPSATIRAYQVDGMGIAQAELELLGSVIRLQLKPKQILFVRLDLRELLSLHAVNRSQHGSTGEHHL